MVNVAGVSYGKAYNNIMVNQQRVVGNCRWTGRSRTALTILPGNASRQYRRARRDSSSLAIGAVPCNRFVSQL